MKTKLYWQFKLPHYLLHHLQVWISSDKTKSNTELNHIQSKHHLFLDVLNYSVYFFKWAATHMHPLTDEHTLTDPNTPGPSGKCLLFCVTAVSTKQKQPKHTLESFPRPRRRPLDFFCATLQAGTAALSPPADRSYCTLFSQPYLH